jgi:hypothetical protein
MRSLVELVRAALGDPRADPKAGNPCFRPNGDLLRQASLFDKAQEFEAHRYDHVRPITTPPAQRHSQTSVRSAAEIKYHAPTLRARVFRYIMEHPGCTDEAIAIGTGLNPSTARPRRVELERAGLIVRAGTAKTSSGRTAVTWQVA